MLLACIAWVQADWVFLTCLVPIANSKTRIRIICLLKLINYIPIDIFTLSYNWIWLFQITKIPLIKCYHWWDNDYDNIIITIIIVISLYLMSITSPLIVWSNSYVLYFIIHVIIQCRVPKSSFVKWVYFVIIGNWIKAL